MAYTTQIKTIVAPAIAPCKDCKDRHIGCHGTCDRYKKYRSKIQKAKWTKKHLGEVG